MSFSKSQEPIESGVLTPEEDTERIPIDLISCQFDTFLAPLSYIVGEMKGNLDSEHTSRMKATLSAACNTWDRLTLIPLIQFCALVFPKNQVHLWQNEPLLSIKAHLNISDAMLGLWDHKSIIRSRWGWVTCDMLEHSLYGFDIWSNIHYGFIGTHIGFDQRTLLDAAGAGQLLGKGLKGILKLFTYSRQLLSMWGDVCAVSSSDSMSELSQLDDPLDQAAILFGISLYDEIDGDPTRLKDEKVEHMLRHSSMTLNTRKCMDLCSYVHKIPEVKHYSIREGVKISPEAEKKVVDLANDFFAKQKKDIVVTSAIRTPKSQADAMYEKLQGTEGISGYKKKAQAKRIEAIYLEAKEKGMSRSETVACMTAEIQRQVAEGTPISDHLLASAVDISVRGMSHQDKSAFQEIAQRHASTVILEKDPPHFHLEFSL